jgi:hypothetical protein
MIRSSKLLSSKGKSVFNSLSLLGLLATQSHFSVALAASAQVHGQGAVVGEFQANLPPNSMLNQGFRMPFGLTIEGRASDRLSLFLDIRASVNSSPETAKPLGNTASTTSVPADGNEFAQPFVPSGGRGEKRENVELGFAYIQYTSPFGVFKAGRMPRHWGLGVYKSAEWKPEGGSISTSDALGATVDFSSTFSASAYWEKTSEGRLSSIQDDADSLTVEALLADNAADPSSNGVVRQIGILFSAYSHPQSSTEIKTLDLFSKIYVGPFLAEGEVLFPSGKTRSLQYGALGGSNLECANPEDNPDQVKIACGKQTIEGFAGLMRLRFQVAGGSNAAGTAGQNLASVDEARYTLGTALRPVSQIVGLWLGYARGDSDSYTKGISTSEDSKVRSTPMHPNIRPSLLMFNPTGLEVPGMPGHQVVNSLFVRGEYSYEAPGVGMITPAIIWGRLDSLNTNPTASTLPVASSSKNLGVEVDIGYSYQTSDNLKMALDAGFWIPGAAWQRTGQSKPSSSYGVRSTVSTTF